jgi:sugar lactone lactonase YvrE
MDHLMGPMEGIWSALGVPTVTPELKQTIVDGVLSEANGRSLDQLARERDGVLLGLLALRRNAESGAAKTISHTNGAAERVFFLDVSGGRLASVTPDGSDFQVLLEGLHRIPDGIQVDVEAGHIYWTNMGVPTKNDGSIERVDLDGNNRLAIVPEGTTFTPKQLALDKKGGKLYWADREGMRVMRANLDGSQIETLVDTGNGDARPGRDATKWCVGIAVDHDRGHMYWTQKGPDNAGKGQILRANLDKPGGESPADRSDIEVLFDGLPEPIDLDLDLDSRLIYWTDRGDAPRGNTVSRAPMDASARNGHQPEVLVTGLMEGIGLALDLKGRRMFFSDLGGSVYSAKLDGSEKRALTFAAGNLTGVAYTGVNDAESKKRSN